MLYALGKWNAWTAAWRAGGVRQVALALLVTLPIQAIVAGVCYLIGLGLGTLFAGDTAIAALSLADVIWMGVLLAVGTTAGAAIIRMEARRPHLSARPWRPWLRWTRRPSSSSIRRH